MRVQKAHTENTLRNKTFKDHPPHPAPPRPSETAEGLCYKAPQTGRTWDVGAKPGLQCLGSWGRDTIRPGSLYFCFLTSVETTAFSGVEPRVLSHPSRTVTITAHVIHPPAPDS